MSEPTGPQTAAQAARPAATAKPRFWRCYNTPCADKPGTPGHDFMAVDPVCDKCGIDRRDPRFTQIITPVVVVHYDPPSPVDGVGQRTLACTGKPIAGFRATGDPEAVNCPACQASEAWQANYAKRQVDPAHDFPVDIDLAKQVLLKAAK